MSFCHEIHLNGRTVCLLIELLTLLAYLRRYASRVHAIIGFQKFERGDQESVMRFLYWAC